MNRTDQFFFGGPLGPTPTKLHIEKYIFLHCTYLFVHYKTPPLKTYNSKNLCRSSKNFLHLIGMVIMITLTLFQ